MEHNNLISLFFRPVFFHSAHRLSEAEWWTGAGTLPGRYLPLCYHLSGLPHAHTACQAGWGLQLCEAAPSCHLPQPGLHGAAATVWDWRSLPRMKVPQVTRGNLYDCTFRVALLPPAGSGLDSEQYQELEQQVNTHSEKTYMCCADHMDGGSGLWKKCVLITSHVGNINPTGITTLWTIVILSQQVGAAME